MDVNSKQSIDLHNDECYFNGAYSCCEAVEMLGVFVYHTTMSKLLHLASMEATVESIWHILHLWMLFNEVLSQISCEPNYKSNHHNCMPDKYRVKS